MSDESVLLPPIPFLVLLLRQVVIALTATKGRLSFWQGKVCNDVQHSFSCLTRTLGTAFKLIKQFHCSTLQVFIAERRAFALSYVDGLCDDAFWQDVLPIKRAKLSLGKFGTFGVRTQQKAATDAEEVSAELVKRITIGFTPSAEIKKAIAAIRIETEV